MNLKNKNFNSKKKAFTLVELLIVIAIIGILFVVLVSKVDFATDKAKTTGVQTDFRSFQVAFETVSRENAGFNSLGWDTGDKADTSLIIGYTYENADKDGGDRIRNSYDKGDMNLNGICEDGETWTGQKIYTETWTGIYTLDNPADATDMSAYLALEKAINKNLDPALQISIDPENKTIYMANGYQDPWTTEYHGFYLTNAVVDGKDRGAIVMYSDGPNKVFGSEQTIANGKVTVTVKNGGINGQDDLSLITCYTYINGYGEIATTTEGFSNNQVFNGNGNGGLLVTPPAGPGTGGYEMLDSPAAPITDASQPVSVRSEAPKDDFIEVRLNGNVVDPVNYTVTEGSTIITFKPEYLATLENGTYTVEVVSTGGSAQCTLTIDVEEEVFVPQILDIICYPDLSTNSRSEIEEYNHIGKPVKSYVWEDFTYTVYGISLANVAPGSVIKISGFNIWNTVGNDSSDAILFVTDYGSDLSGYFVSSVGIKVDPIYTYDDYWEYEGEYYVKIPENANIDGVYMVGYNIEGQSVVVETVQYEFPTNN